MGRFDKYKTNKQDVKTDVAKEINLMRNQEQYNLQFIKITKLIKSPFNKFDEYKDSKHEKWLEIKNSIQEYGVLNPFKVILNEQGSYEVLAGWNRTQMIKELISEGNEKFLEGVPCYVLPTNTSEIDQQIIAEIDNTGEGHTDPQEVRESIARLAILYQQKNEQEGTNKSIVKQISQDTGLGERQVQRYNSINKKMIPALQDYFDNKQINIENGSKIADLPEEGQKLILNILEQSDSNKKISADEIKIVKEQSQKLKEELREKEELTKKLEEQASILEEQKRKLEEQKQKEIEEKDVQIKNTLLKLEEREIELKNKLEQERENLETKEINKFKQELENLINDKETLSLEKEELEEEKKQLEQKTAQKEKEVESLKNKIKDLEKKKEENQQSKIDSSKMEELKLEIKMRENIKDIIHKLGVVSTQISQNSSLKKNLQDELSKLKNSINQVNLS